MELAGKLENGRESAVGTLLKLIQGECLRAYSPLVQVGGSRLREAFGVALEGVSGGEHFGSEVGGGSLAHRAGVPGEPKVLPANSAM